jgi:hypothetical protein
MIFDLHGDLQAEYGLISTDEDIKGGIGPLWNKLFAAIAKR